MGLKEIQSKHKTLCEKRNSLKEKIEFRKRQIERLENRVDKVDISWTENLIRPIMDVVSKRFKTLTWSYERLIPMGLRNSVSVFGSDKDGKCISALTFTIGDYDNGELFIDTNIVDKSYESGSIGYLNGFHKKTKKVQSLVTIFDTVTESIERNT